MARVVGMATVSIVRTAGAKCSHVFPSSASVAHLIGRAPLEKCSAAQLSLSKVRRFICRGGSVNSNSNSEREWEKVPSRLSHVESLLEGASEGADGLNQPVPRISLDNVSLSFARSGGPGGQNVNKVNTKVDMRFNVMAANWLPTRVKLKLLQMEKNRINSDGDLIVSSTRTRTQKGNIEDALGKLQEMIDAAAYVPPPPSEEKKQKMRKLANIENERRLQDKKRSSTKKSERRNKGSWD